MLKHFISALEISKNTLDYHQYWRYAKAGKLPKLLTWLVERPDLAEALAADARDLARDLAADRDGGQRAAA